MAIPENIIQKMDAGLHIDPRHPIGIVKGLVQKRLKNFPKFDDLNPEVSVYDNFDALRIPQDHPSRSPNDTYYVTRDRVLRTHTSAHQYKLLQDYDRFLVTGDVYRRDSVDRFHYPVFHQMDGVKICSYPVEELQSTVNALLNELFPDAPRRWSDSHF